MPINHPKFLWVTGGCLAFLLIYLALHERGYTPQFKGVPSLHTSWEYEPERDERNLGLSEDQCQVYLWRNPWRRKWSVGGC